jgi:hypothetical protein
VSGSPDDFNFSITFDGSVSPMDLTPPFPPVVANTDHDTLLGHLTTTPWSSSALTHQSGFDENDAAVSVSLATIAAHRAQSFAADAACVAARAEAAAMLVIPATAHAIRAAMSNLFTPHGRLGEKGPCAAEFAGTNFTPFFFWLRWQQLHPTTYEAMPMFHPGSIGCEGTTTCFTEFVGASLIAAAAAKKAVLAATRAVTAISRIVVATINRTTEEMLVHGRRDRVIQDWIRRVVPEAYEGDHEDNPLLFGLIVDTHTPTADPRTPAVADSNTDTKAAPTEPPPPPYVSPMSELTHTLQALFGPWVTAKVTPVAVRGLPGVTRRSEGSTFAFSVSIDLSPVYPDEQAMVGQGDPAASKQAAKELAASAILPALQNRLAGLPPPDVRCRGTADMKCCTVICSHSDLRNRHDLVVAPVGSTSVQLLAFSFRKTPLRVFTVSSGSESELAEVTCQRCSALVGKLQEGDDCSRFVVFSSRSKGPLFVPAGDASVFLPSWSAADGAADNDSIGAISIDPPLEDPPNLTDLNGDLFKVNAYAVVQQTNARSTGAVVDCLAARMHREFPLSNTYYSKGHERYHKRIPGQLSTHSTCQSPGARIQVVVNIVGQDFPGGPSLSEPPARRLRWFRQGLRALAVNKSLPSVAFPKGIGCGIGGGDWRRYREAIKEFATACPEVQVFIVNLDVGHTCTFVGCHNRLDPAVFQAGPKYEGPSAHKIRWGYSVNVGDIRPFCDGRCLGADARRQTFHTATGSSVPPVAESISSLEALRLSVPVAGDALASTTMPPPVGPGSTQPLHGGGSLLPKSLAELNALLTASPDQTRRSWHDGLMVQRDPSAVKVATAEAGLTPTAEPMDTGPDAAPLVAPQSPNRCAATLPSGSHCKKRDHFSSSLSADRPLCSTHPSSTDLTIPDDPDFIMDEILDLFGLEEPFPCGNGLGGLDASVSNQPCPGCAYCLPPLDSPTPLRPVLPGAIVPAYEIMIEFGPNYTLLARISPLPSLPAATAALGPLLREHGFKWIEAKRHWARGCHTRQRPADAKAVEAMLLPVANVRWQANSRERCKRDAWAPSATSRPVGRGSRRRNRSAAAPALPR